MNQKKSLPLNIYVRALRLPFITASVLPFIFGSLIAREHFRVFSFCLGLICTISTHLGANLVNDYADSRSGVDWKDRKFFGFFGGSKLIQENILSERFYLQAALIFFFVAAVCVVFLSILLKSFSVYLYFTLILFLGFSYSHKPFQFVYRRLGEIIIFILFGPAVVMGAHFIQTGIFPTWEGFLLSLPFGFFTMAILFSNEIPDLSEDKAAGKMTWVSVVGGEKSYILYYSIIALGFVSIIINIGLGLLSAISWGSFIFAVLALKAGRILKESFSDKTKLIQSSQATIALQTFVSLVLITGIVF